MTTLVFNRAATGKGSYKGDAFNATCDLNVMTDWLKEHPPVEVNGKKLPAASVAYLIHYGLKQTLSDSYAGAEDKAEAEGSFGKRLDQILKGETPTPGARGPRLDPMAAMVRKVAFEQVQAAIRAKGAKMPEAGELLKLVEKNLGKDAFRAACEKEAKRRIGTQDKIEVDVAL